MSIAEKFEVIADAVYEKGKQAEYDRFWDAFQQNGQLTSYVYGFAGQGWKDDIFKPKYPIITNASPNRTNAMFYYSNLTEIMTPLYFYDTTANSTFYQMTKCVRIGDDSGGGIWVTKDRTFTTNFTGCKVLEEIRFLDYNEKGEYVPSKIGNSIDFKESPLLSTASIVNIVEHLVNSSTVTLTINSTAKGNMSFPYTSPQTNVTYNSWDELVATKPDCTISLA